MQNIKLFIIVIVFVYFPVIFFYCLIMAAAYPILCCYSLNGFNGCIPGCVTLTTLLQLFVALCGLLNTFVYLKRQRFVLLGAYNGDITVHNIMHKRIKEIHHSIWLYYLEVNSPLHRNNIYIYIIHRKIRLYMKSRQISLIRSVYLN